MKRFYLFGLLFFFGNILAKAQCPPGDIMFTTQQEIDDFAATGCTVINGNLIVTGADITNLDGLSGLTTVTKLIAIESNPVLVDIDGLAGITTFPGGIKIAYNTILPNINGMPSITSAYPPCDITGNDALTNLSGLSNITSFGSRLIIDSNPMLTDLTGLNMVGSVGGFLRFDNNADLENLNALSNLTSVGAFLQITNNPALTSLSGLSLLTSIGGQLEVRNNNVLTSLSGLDNIAPASITNLVLILSGSLSTCEVPSICSYLQNGSPATIFGNATGCNSQAEVLAACPNCPSGNITFSTQAEIDDFQSNYPGCTAISGNLTISGADITNLNGLSTILAITGDLTITWNPMLSDLTGLNGLSGSGALSGSLAIQNNGALTDLTGLTNVTAIGGSLLLTNNDALTDLTGLHNIAYASITYLFISYNDLLSICHVANVCSYLENGGSANIAENAPGCYNQFEVLSRCLCPEGDVTFSTQAEIDAFTTNYPGCTNIYGNLTISGADIDNLGELSVINYIFGNLSIVGNPILPNLTGLEGLHGSFGGSPVAGNLLIQNNGSLTDLSGLSSLPSIGGQLQIVNNDDLTSLNGLDNIAYTSITNLTLQSSAMLSTCNVPSICNYLANGGAATISGNATGCNTQAEVVATCCPTGDFIFSTQAQIDAFPGSYPGCTQLLGNVTVEGSDITNLNELLGVITSIGGNLQIINNPMLGGSIANYSSLTSIGGNLVVMNNSLLFDLTGLNFVNSIGGNLEVSNNLFLSSLAALNSVQSIGGVLKISENDALQTLSGLGNIDSGTITNLIIEDSYFLYVCDVASICSYLSNPSNPAAISGNASGCATRPEVGTKCSSPCPDNLVIRYQGEVDNFSSDYPGCTQLTGSITSNGSNINNLYGLSQLIQVGGELTLFNNPFLSGLSGLENIETIGGGLNLSQLPNLNSLSGLQSLETVQ
ncbi:MAG: hypothetical protein ACKV1O_21100, partial [Saprospiraceae bacterium]